MSRPKQGMLKPGTPHGPKRARERERGRERERDFSFRTGGIAGSRIPKIRPNMLLPKSRFGSSDFGIWGSLAPTGNRFELNMLSAPSLFGESIGLENMGLSFFGDPTGSPFVLSFKTTPTQNYVF